MIRHSTTDGNIPNRRGKRLYTAPPEPKIKIEAEGAGRLAAWDNGAREPAPKALIAEPRRTHGVRLRKRLPAAQAAGDVQQSRSPAWVECWTCGNASTRKRRPSASTSETKSRLQRGLAPCGNVIAARMPRARLR